MGWVSMSMSMSMRPVREGEIPADGVRVARAAFPKGSLAIRLWDELGVLFRDGRFAALFLFLGRPAWSPGWLALVSVVRYAEGLPDRQAALAVRARIDWKGAKGTGLGSRIPAAKWTLLFVPANQVALTVVTNYANAADQELPTAGAGYTAYSSAQTVWLLPQSIVTSPW
jgi:hypothetical protein